MKATVYQNDRTSHTFRATQTPSRKTSLAAGVLYLLTFILVPTAVLYAPVRDANYMLGSGPDTGIIIGCILELIVALAGIGTAVALYPVVKRQNQGIALGFIGSRTLEAATIFAGVVCLMTMVTLRQSGAGAEAKVTGRTLLAMYDWFHLGQNLMPAINAVLLGSLLYQLRLVPRILPVLGFIGAPLLVANTIIVMFGVTGPALTLTILGALPIAIWEFSLGAYLTFKGFKPSVDPVALEKVEANQPVSAA